MERVKEKGENREVEGGRRVKRRKERPFPSATPPFPAALFPWRQHEAMTITSGRYYYPIMFSYNFDFLVHPPAKKENVSEWLDILEKKMCRPSTLISHPETGSSFLSWSHASLLWSILGWPHTRTRSLVFPGQSFFTYVLLISSHSTFKTPSLDDIWREHPRQEPCHSTPTCGLLSYSSAITLLNFRVRKLLLAPWTQLAISPFFSMTFALP